MKPVLYRMSNECETVMQLTSSIALTKKAWQSLRTSIGRNITMRLRGFVNRSIISGKYSDIHSYEVAFSDNQIHFDLGIASARGLNGACTCRLIIKFLINNLLVRYSTQLLLPIVLFVWKFLRLTDCISTLSTFPVIH